MPEDTSSNNLVIALAVLIGSIFLSFIILRIVCHQAWTRRRMNRHLNELENRDSRAALSDERANYLEVIRRLEVDAMLEFFDESSVKTESWCAICLDRLDGNGSAREMDDTAVPNGVAVAPCLHVLHVACWKAWLIKDPAKACPICRVPIKVPDPDLQNRLDNPNCDAFNFPPPTAHSHQPQPPHLAIDLTQTPSPEVEAVSPTGPISDDHNLQSDVNPETHTPNLSSQNQIMQETPLQTNQNSNSTVPDASIIVVADGFTPPSAETHGTQATHDNRIVVTPNVRERTSSQNTNNYVTVD